VRKLIGNNWIIGIACHSSEEVKRALEEGADHVLVAPVFDTPSKPGMKPMGLEKLSEICRSSPVPVFALGGVSPENAPSCIDAGAKGLAGIRLFQQAPDLGALCATLKQL
jgi:thiamine-phosphate pyrophosphorylase